MTNHNTFNIIKFLCLYFIRRATTKIISFFNIFFVACEFFVSNLDVEILSTCCLKIHFCFDNDIDIYPTSNWFVVFYISTYLIVFQITWKSLIQSFAFNNLRSGTNTFSLNISPASILLSFPFSLVIFLSYCWI